MNCTIHKQILVGNKSDMGKDKRAVSYAAGEQLAREYGIPFFETSAKTGSNVDEVSCYLYLVWNISSLW